MSQPIGPGLLVRLVHGLDMPQARGTRRENTMMCATCGHAHVSTEQVVRYTEQSDTFAVVKDVVESTLMICSEPGCRCSELDPVSYDDRVALIQAGELE